MRAAQRWFFSSADTDTWEVGLVACVVLLVIVAVSVTIAPSFLILSMPVVSFGILAVAFWRTD